MTLTVDTFASLHIAEGKADKSSTRQAGLFWRHGTSGKSDTTMPFQIYNVVTVITDKCLLARFGMNSDANQQIST